jgi:lipopolysaccharide cholinephosphotransferase
MEDLSCYNPEGSLLRKAQMRMLEIAIEFDQICQRNNITYWLMSGTLLGARRHGGFIPWDDDFDVGVKMEDYKRLLDCLQVELPDNLKLQTRETDADYPLLFAKIRDSQSNVSEKIVYRNYKYNGLFIDIFPFESICVNKKIKFPIDVRYAKLKYDLKKGLFWKLVTNLLFYISFTMVFVLRLIGKFTRNRYSHAYGIAFYAPHKLSTCFPVSKIKFEDYEFSAPCNIDQYLEDEYGNFMVIPSKDKRYTHEMEIVFHD